MVSHCGSMMIWWSLGKRGRLISTWVLGSFHFEGALLGVHGEALLEHLHSAHLLQAPQGRGLASVFIFTGILTAFMVLTRLARLADIFHVAFFSFPSFFRELLIRHLSSFRDKVRIRNDLFRNSNEISFR